MARCAVQPAKHDVRMRTGSMRLAIGLHVKRLQTWSVGEEVSPGAFDDKCIGKVHGDGSINRRVIQLCYVGRSSRLAREMPSFCIRK